MPDEYFFRVAHLGQQGYTCSQIMMLMALETQGKENSDLIRAMNGLAYGCGTGRSDCGILSGGCCVLALYTGNGTEQSQTTERLALMQNELGEWFSNKIVSRQGDISCNAIVGESGPDASRETCGRIVAETFAKVMEILINKGFDPYSPE
ncbi:MAG: C-GCAxxG-C-C family protein [Desulfobacterales bacterium]|nr:C-GCAxxG-C-C family protein [Desulfobacterales bacterium]